MATATDRLDLEIRHIETSKLTKLSAIIDKSKAWDDLLEELSRPSSSTAGRANDLRLEPLALPLDSIDLIKQQDRCGKSPTLALLNHWAITGRRRPTIKTLLYYLNACNLKWAVDYVREAILGIEPVPAIRNEPPQQKKAAAAEDSPQSTSECHVSPEKSDSLAIEAEYKFDNLQEVISQLDKGFTEYCFEAIYETTNRFCHRPYDHETKVGTRIGDGRFSSVFLAKSFKQNSEKSLAVVAAKLLKSECNRNYLANEINLARKVKHQNILDLLGIALGSDQGDTGPSYICLIYRYIQNGSLHDCISRGLPCDNLRQLNWLERLEIAVKVSRGIGYLHSFKDGPIIHRDIKTANILIDLDLEPKVGDFTSVRQLEIKTNVGETQYSQNIIGTSVYMPPEAFRGDISTKFDTFSFGIVLLELLTGLGPFDKDLDEDLITHISEKLSDIDDKLLAAAEGSSDLQANELRDKLLADLLDKKAGKWRFDLAKAQFNLSLRATENKKKNRPELLDLIPELEQILSLAASDDKNSI